MYVIGLTEYNFVKIKIEQRYSLERIEPVVMAVLYDMNLEEATLFYDYNKADGILNQIRERKDEISFSNCSVCGQILDKHNGYKLNVNDLKIFELVPMEYIDEDVSEPMYVVTDAIDFIAERCDIDKETIAKVLSIEEDYMRSLGLIVEEEE